MGARDWSNPVYIDKYMYTFSTCISSANTILGLCFLSSLFITYLKACRRFCTKQGDAWMKRQNSCHSRPSALFVESRSPPIVMHAPSLAMLHYIFLPKTTHLQHQHVQVLGATRRPLCQSRETNKRVPRSFTS